MNAMNLVLLTNDNYFSFTVLRPLLEAKKDEIKLIVFSSALIGKRGTFESIKWSVENTGIRHTLFKLSVYGVFRFLKYVCRWCPWVENRYSSFLWAKKNEKHYMKANNINSKEVVQRIKEIQPDLIISVSMNQVVKREILDIPPLHCINVHCAPLPRYGGMSPYVWALANNEDYSASTIHYMEEGLDEGDIIVQEKVKILEKDTAFALFHRCCLVAAEQLLEVVCKIESGTVTAVPQDLSKKTYFSWPTNECIKILRKNGFKLAQVTDFFRAICGKNPYQ